MRRPLLIVALLLAASAARATVWTGRDYAGQDIVAANGDIVQGTFTNVGLFRVPAGNTVYVSPGIPLTLYASTVSIEGTLDGRGKGRLGGGGGAAAGPGSKGFSGDAAGNGGGAGGAIDKGGAGGGGGAAGGAGGGGAAGGGVYGSTGVALGAWLSSDDSFMGSGGGGGGGGDVGGLPGGAGAAGGAGIYIEASSMSLTGSILASGDDAAAVTTVVAGSQPGAGGGGAGGTILLRVPGELYLHGGTALTAKGGKGGDVAHIFGGVNNYPGGGGAGGRVKLFYGTLGVFGVTLSTTAGAAGGFPFGTPANIAAPAPAAGTQGGCGFGTIASSPTSFAVGAVHISSISWSWNNGVAWGDAADGRAFRVYATSAPPLPAAAAVAGAAASSVYEQSLTPNTTYQRWVTAVTDWGDSLASYSASTHTLAAQPALDAPAFSGLAAASLSFHWTAGSPGNPGYTVYEVRRSTEDDFSAAVSTSYLTATSSSPANLTPNTTYYFQTRAVNADNVPTDFTSAAATCTLAAVPGSPGLASVWVTSAVFSWTLGSNPGGTRYQAEVSTDNFSTVNWSTLTLTDRATFYSLTPGVVYTFRAFALNHASAASDFTALRSTVTGATTDTSSPAPPGSPEADRRYSYDGSATFVWTAASAPSGILDYWLEIGTSPGASDFFSGSVGSALTYAASGMATSRTYYARVRARNNGGVWSQYSASSAGLPVYRPAQESAFAKPKSWPNPFDPDAGAAQIGFEVSEPATVTFKVYTLQGGLVHEETRRLDAAGNQVWTWSGRNDSGGMAAPGGYIGFIEKRYDGRTESQKFKMAVLY